MVPLPSSVKIVEKKGNKAIFEIEGLYPGYGITIGNNLRRVLLSSIEGAAITKVKIKGVQHEFSTIPGVLEDVLRIIINLKQVRCKLYGDEPQKLELSIRGEREIKAGDFKTPTQVEIINKDAHIATLTGKNSSLDIDLVVERGLGYVPAESRKKEKLEIGTIILDAIFTPTKGVAVKIENMRVGDRTDFDRLFLEVETDGSITPEEAFVRAAEVAFKHFEQIYLSLQATEELVSSREKTAGDAGKKSIEELGLSARTMKVLLNNNIKTVGGLTRKSEVVLSKLEGLGDKGLAEIKRKLKKSGLELK